MYEVQLNHLSSLIFLVQLFAQSYYTTYNVHNKNKSVMRNCLNVTSKAIKTYIRRNKKYCRNASLLQVLKIQSVKNNNKTAGVYIIPLQVLI